MAGYEDREAIVEVRGRQVVVGARYADQVGMRDGAGADAVESLIVKGSSGDGSTIRSIRAAERYFDDDEATALAVEGARSGVVDVERLAAIMHERVPDARTVCVTVPADFAAKVVEVLARHPLHELPRDLAVFEADEAPEGRPGED